MAPAVGIGGAVKPPGAPIFAGLLEVWGEGWMMRAADKGAGANPQALGVRCSGKGKAESLRPGN